MATVVTATKPPAGKRERDKESGKPAKPIRLDDLIPSGDVTGGRKAVFGSVPASKRKPPK